MDGGPADDVADKTTGEAVKRAAGSAADASAPPGSARPASGEAPAATVRPPALRRADLQPLEAEMEFSAVRAQGAGGQNVNKVSNAVHLRYDVRASSLPEAVKARLLAGGDARITRDGVVVIKAQEHRSLERNRQEAIGRLAEMIAAAAHVPKARRPTKPTLASKRRRIEAKVQRGRVKALRGAVKER